MPIPDTQLRAFYSAGALALRALDRRSTATPRFGPDADAEWSLFRGELHDGDRLDLLVRDAAVAHPATFAPRVVFSLDGLSDDEAFGPEWPGVPAPHAAAALRQAAAAAEAQPDAWLRRIAQAWSLEVVEAPPSATAALKSVLPSTRLLTAGAGSVLALARHFAGRTDLDLGDQVAFFSASPAERQLFGAAVALLDRPAPARVFSPDTTADQLRARGFKRADLVLVSASAEQDPTADLSTRLEALRAALA